MDDDEHNCNVASAQAPNVQFLLQYWALSGWDPRSPGEPLFVREASHGVAVSSSRRKQLEAVARGRPVCRARPELAGQRALCI